MEFEELSIPGVWLAQSSVHSDPRGSFREWFKFKEFKEKTGVNFVPQQANTSMSQKNVVRGLHFSNVPGGQAKFVSCLNGSIIDVIVDLRRKSESFLQSIQIELGSKDGRSIYIPEGFGHGFQSLQDNSIIVYQLSTEYNPISEHTIDIFDEELKLGWSREAAILSDRDAMAPGMKIQFDNLPS